MIKTFMYNYVQLNQENIESSLEFLVGEMNMLSVRLLTNNGIYNLIADKRITEDSKRVLLKGILDEMKIDRDLIGELAIVTSDGTVYKMSNNLWIDDPDRTYIKQITESKTPVWGKVNKDEHGDSYILLGRKYQNFYTGQNLGSLIVYVKERALYHLFKNVIVPDWGFSFLVADDNYILSYPDTKMAGTTIYDPGAFTPEPGSDFKVTTFEGKPSILAMYRFQGSLRNMGLNWKVISIISDEKLFKNVNKIKTYTIAAQLSTLLLAIFLALYVSRKISNPVNRLNRKINKVGKDNRLFNAYNQKHDELWVLEKSFDAMVVRIGDLIERNNLEKDRQREMELIALQAQINPHFLYNTLDAIAWMAKINKQNDIEKMIILLAQFFRLSLHKGDKYITVAEEIGIVQSYVAIEAMRFPDKFTVDYDIEESILDYDILKIIIQPLVENAIKHGISRKRGLGHIKVKGYRATDDLLFEITDDGPGFNRQEIGSAEPTPRYKGGGYGIRNVNERISIEYGEEYGVDVQSVIGEGTLSTVKVKVKR